MWSADAVGLAKNFLSADHSVLEAMLVGRLPGGRLAVQIRHTSPPPPPNTNLSLFIIEWI